MQDNNDYPDRSKEALINSGLGIDLSDGELAQVASLVVEVGFKKGERILKEGSKSRDLFIVVEGQVSVMLDLRSAQTFEERIARLNAPEIFGEFAFVNGQARSASIQAETKVKLLRLDHTALMDLFSTNPQIGYLMIRNIAALITKRISDQRSMLRRLLFNG